MGLSPMMKYYLSVKENYKDAILLFRLGDFYEMFFDDAKLASELLDLTLTGRDCGLEQRAPMCGVPYHAVDGYISKLIAKGYKVAICEQLTSPEESKGMLERDVVRVITPGTVIEDDILDDKKNNYLVSIAVFKNTFALAWADVSTGEFNTLDKELTDFSALEDALATIVPAEIICNKETLALTQNVSDMRLSKLPKFQNYNEWSFEYSNAEKALKEQFSVASLDVFEIKDKKACVMAAGALCTYLKDTQKRALSHMSGIRYVRNERYMVLDATARRNLEITQNARDGSSRATLIKVMDKTRTSMGARNLRRWLEQPLRDEKEINARLDAVEELISSGRVRSNLDEKIGLVKDLERLCTKLVYGNPSPRDFVAIKQSLEVIPLLKSELRRCDNALLKAIEQNMFELESEYNMLADMLADNPPALTKDGGFIREGYSEELDGYRSADKDGKIWLAKLESDEKEATGIKNLRVGYNKVFGYYIEVSKGNVDKVPFRYVRKQTLTTGERYITEELKDIEDKILGAVEKSIKLELALFEQIKLEMLKAIPMLQSTARAVATCDTLLAFAKLSVAGNYCRPVINDNIESISIKSGRHPVVEALMKSDEFVPNDTELDCYQNRTMIITGPNMAGKSTYMRQVALITFMAHVGCFVPAKSAEIAITDRIFTRIGASDDLAYGQSTFMVEMVEVATILQNATMRSLLILDEIGRGTSTFDGLSIAKAVLEDVTARIRCKTLFSTHFHELTELEGTLEGAVNYKIVAAEKDKGIIFLHKIMRGGTNKSFGIEVAKLAGLPQKVISRARAVSKELESDAHKSKIAKSETRVHDMVDMMEENAIMEELRSLDVNNMSPIQAINTLGELVKKALKR